MSNPAKQYLIEKLNECGVKRVHDAYKKVELDRSPQLGAVLFHEEKPERDGSKSKFINEMGVKTTRIRVLMQTTKYIVLIADRDADKCNELKNAYLLSLGGGVDDGAGNWIDIDVLDTDFSEQEDSVLQGKAVAKLLVQCQTGLYEDVEHVLIENLNITMK